MVLVPVRPLGCNDLEWLLVKESAGAGAASFLVPYVYFKVKDGVFSAEAYVLSKFGMLRLPLDLLL